MIQLFPLRPVQIVDVSFQLLRTRFARSFAIAFCIALPLQALLWAIQASSPSEKDLSGRIILIIAIVQFSAVGISLALTSNALSKTTGRVYCSTIFNNIYTIHKSPSRILIAIYHVAVQVAFAVALIGIRFFLGQVTLASNADRITTLIFILAIVPWIFFTLRFGFAVPISVHEGGGFGNILKRNRQINKVHYFKLFGVYCITVFMILILIIPSLLIVEIFIAKNFVSSDVGELAFTNLIIAVVIASISTVYSYILTVTYFNARIEHEGFDISVAIQQSEIEEGTRGKLFNSVA